MLAKEELLIVLRHVVYWQLAIISSSASMLNLQTQPSAAAAALTVQSGAVCLYALHIQYRLSLMTVAAGFLCTIRFSWHQLDIWQQLDVRSTWDPDWSSVSAMHAPSSCCPSFVPCQLPHMIVCSVFQWYSCPWCSPVLLPTMIAPFNDNINTLLHLHCCQMSHAYCGNTSC